MPWYNCAVVSGAIPTPKRQAINMTDKELVIDAVSRLPDATPIEVIQEEVDSYPTR